MEASKSSIYEGMGNQHIYEQSMREAQINSIVPSWYIVYV